MLIDAIENVSIGLRAKTGRAVAVVVGGSADAPCVMARTELLAADPSIPATYNPYHEVMDLPWERARVAVKKTLDQTQKIATTSLSDFLRELQAEGRKVVCVGIVGAGDRNLEKMGGAHIRAHAAEGLWFRQVLELAAKNCKLKFRSYDERRLHEIASSELALSVEKLSTRVTELGQSVGRPWRADEKAAAVAAWLTLLSKPD